MFDRLGYHLDNPGKMLDFQSGGGAVVGGFIGVALAAVSLVYLLRYRGERPSLRLETA